jgi:hypothetical protein
VDEQKGVHIEFGLTGRHTRSGPRVCATLGPFLATSSLSVVEARLVRELVRYRLGARAGEPLVAACVADQPWPVSPGWLRDLLYGRARAVTMLRDGDRTEMELEFDAPPAPCLFRDPLYRDLSALIWLGRNAQDATRAHCRVFLNPWALAPLDASVFPHCPVLAFDRRTERGTAMRWHPRNGPNVVLL